LVARVLFCVVLTVVGPAGAWAQVSADAGEISGTILDPLGGPVPAATVILDDNIRGVIRTATTDINGRYLFPLVAPSTYSVECRASGFALRMSESFVVVAGRTVRLDVGLELAEVQVAVDVRATPSALDPVRVTQTETIEAPVIDALPIGRRDLLAFVLLTPGVTDSSRLADQADFRVPIAPSSGLSFAGNNGRGNVVLLDGLSNMGATGNVRPSVAQSAVEDLQVSRSTYSAEYGGAIGGVVNIVTKAGTSAQHVDGFVLVGDRGFDARNPFDSGRAPFTRVQSGGTISGPLVPARAFYFGTLERLDRHDTTFVSVLPDLTVLHSIPSGQSRVLNAMAASGDPVLAGVAPLARTLLTPASNPFVERVIVADRGAFPQAEDATTGSFRGDVRWATQSLMVRVNGSGQNEEGARAGGLIGYSHGDRIRWRDRTVAASDAYALGNRWIGMTRFSFARTTFEMLPNDALGPELLVGGFGSFGRDYLLPFVQHERYLQLQQTIARSGARNELKAGVSINPIRDSGRVDTFFGGRFVFGDVIPFAGVLAALAADPGVPERVARITNNDPALTQPITALQSFGLGLPLAYVQAFGDSASASNRQQDSAFAEYTFHGPRNVTLVGGLRLHHNDTANLRAVNYLEPRAGIAWAPSPNTALRGGFGVFHSWVDLNIDYSAVQLKRSDVHNIFIPLSGVPQVVNPVTGLPVTSADVYGGLLAGGVLGTRAVTPADLARFGISDRLPFPVTGSVRDDYESPASRHASVELEHAVRGWTIGASYEYQRASHLWRTRDYNLRAVATRPDGFPIFALADPTIFDNFVIESTGRAAAHAMILRGARRLRGGWTVDGHYTFTVAHDDVTDFNIDYAPHNQVDPAADWGPSSFAERHRFVATTIVDLPLDQTQHRPLTRWTFAAVTQAHSGKPFNVLTGFDNVGDGQTNTHRPLGVSRNAGRGPSFFAVDVRARTPIVRSGGSDRVWLTVDAFNLFNRTNFASVNNIVGGMTRDALPSPLVGHAGDPSTPLAFTSAYEARRLEFGLAVRF
jgi:hypothetical protein